MNIYSWHQKLQQQANGFRYMLGINFSFQERSLLMGVGFWTPYSNILQYFGHLR